MRLATLILSSAIASFAVGGVAWTAERMPAAVKVHDGMLTDDKGMTLYIFDNDKTPDKSSCNGNCLMNWPALKAEASDKDVGEFKVITRDDGSKQWAFKGKPLYHFRMDAKAGDTTGEGRGMVWHIARL